MAGKVLEADERVVLRIDPQLKERAQQAAETRDGGNLSRLVRRAIIRLIEEERLLESAPVETQERVA